MQIYEVTQIDEQGFLGGIKQAAQTAASGIKQSAQAAMGNVGAQAAQNTDMLGSAMAKQWNMKAAQLAQAAATAGGGTVSDQEYSGQLMDFVEKNMLQKKSNELDQTSRQRLGQMIGKVVSSRNDSRQLDQAFRDLAKITTTARLDPQLTRGSRVPSQSAQTVAQTGAAAQPQMTPQQARQQAQQTLDQMIGRTQQAGLTKYLGGGTVRSTGNATVDGLLNILGVQTR
jgi:hypothetical protein